MRIVSSAFEHNAAIPAQYTCDGPGVSPPLAFHEVPAGAQTLALIVDDPDAPMGVWDHWLWYNIPIGAGTLPGLPEAVPAEAYPPQGGAQGLNSWRRVGYGAPCPPSGTHRYLFKLFALDAKLNLKAGVAKPQLLRAMDGRILAEALLMGTYSRAK